MISLLIIAIIAASLNSALLHKAKFAEKSALCKFNLLRQKGTYLFCQLFAKDTRGRFSCVLKCNIDLYVVFILIVSLCIVLVNMENKK